jgi:hypothetical protein
VVVPPVVPLKGRTSVYERPFRVRVKSGKRPEVWGFIREGGSVAGKASNQQTLYWYRRSSLGLDSISGTS